MYVGLDFQQGLACPSLRALAFPSLGHFCSLFAAALSLLAARAGS